MDISSPLKADVLRPLLTWLVPGAVLIAPYLLLLGAIYPEVSSFAASNSVITALLCFFAALAGGVVLENLGSIIEVQIWDALLEHKTGWQNSVWLEYLQLVHEKEPIAQRYLRTVVMRMKFELSFSLALIGSWLGTIILHDRQHIFTDGGLLLFSFVVLVLAAYLLWESGRSAEVLTNLRALMVTGMDAPVMKYDPEPQPCAVWFDRSVRVAAVVMLIGGLIMFIGVLYRHRYFEPGSGYTSVALWFGIGAAFALTPVSRMDGRRREAALKLALLGLLAFMLILVRMLTTESSLVNWIGASWFALLGLYFRGFAHWLPEENRKPHFIRRDSAREAARVERLSRNTAF